MMRMMVATAMVFIDLPTKTIAKIDNLALLVGQGRSSRSLMCLRLLR